MVQHSFSVFAEAPYRIPMHSCKPISAFASVHTRKYAARGQRYAQRPKDTTAVACLMSDNIGFQPKAD